MGQRLDDRVRARDQRKLGRNLAGQLFGHKLIAHPRQQNHALLLVGEPGVMHDLLWMVEHAGRMGQASTKDTSDTPLASVLGFASEIIGLVWVSSMAVPPRSSEGR